jgi:hypothetical protein
MPRQLPSAPRVWVTVSQETIDAACEADSGHCMIADAMTASIPAASRTSADLATLRFTDKDKGLRYVYLTPRWVQEALLRFDMGDRPKPFRFQLRNGTTVRSGGRGTGARHAARPPAATLVQVSDSGIPEVRGGSAPPMGALAGGSIGSVSKSRRRTFGLRAMDRYVSTRAAEAALAERGARDALA